MSPPSVASEGRPDHLRGSPVACSCSSHHGDVWMSSGDARQVGQWNRFAEICLLVKEPSQCMHHQMSLTP